MKYISLVVTILGLVLTGWVSAPAQMGESRITPEVEPVPQSLAPAVQTTAVEQRGASGRPEAQVTPTARELYLTAYEAAQRAASGIDSEKSLQVLESEIESIVMYIRQELARVQQEKALRPGGQVQAEPVPQPLLRKQPESQPGEMEPNLVTPITDQSSEERSSILGADEPQPESVWEQLKRLTGRVERLERALSIVREATSAVEVAPQ